MEFKDYYEALGVGPDSSANDIKEAYKYKVNVLHPDRLMGVSESIRSRAEEDLKKVNHAYDVLGNPTRRKKYHAEWLSTTNSKGNMKNVNENISEKEVKVFSILEGILGLLMLIRVIRRFRRK